MRKEKERDACDAFDKDGKIYEDNEERREREKEETEKLKLKREDISVEICRRRD